MVPILSGEYQRDLVHLERMGEAAPLIAGSGGSVCPPFFGAYTSDPSNRLLQSLRQPIDAACIYKQKGATWLRFWWNHERIPSGIRAAA